VFEVAFHWFLSGAEGHKGHGSLVGIATGYGLDNRRAGVWVPVVKNFEFCISSRLALESTEPPIQ
jgi:hypothetical protein